MYKVMINKQNMTSVICGIEEYVGNFT